MTYETPPDNFTYILFERTNTAENIARFYYLGWQPTLIDTGAVIRIYGRKNGAQQTITPQPFNSLAEAWPLLRGVIKARLRHGYRVVEPAQYVE